MAQVARLASDRSTLTACGPILPKPRQNSLFWRPDRVKWAIVRAHVSTHTTLLNRLTAGEDTAAWSEFNERYGELIRGFARRKGIQQADCDDLLQDVLVSLTKSMPGFQYDPAKGRFRSFLKTVVMRAMYRKFWQKRGDLRLEDVGQAADLEWNDSDTEDVWEAEWQQYHLRLAMRTIDLEFSEADRIAFKHYVVAGQAPQDTAALLGLTINQVYKAKSNILKRLSELIDEQVKEEG